jgi:hypothetical protein
MTPTALILTAVAVIFVIGLVAVIVERTEQRDEAYDLVAKAHKTATDAVAQTETFADELIAERMESAATHAANEILCAELAASDQKIRRLSNDLLAAHKRISDAENVIPLPVEHNVIALRGEPDDLAALDAEATAYTWPSIARDIHNDEWAAIMRAVEEDR